MRRVVSPVMNSGEKVYSLYKELQHSRFSGHPAVILENLGIANLIFGKLCGKRLSASGDLSLETGAERNHVRTMQGYIQKYFSTPIQVQDVLDFVQLERSCASRLYKAATGHSMGREILNRRISLAGQYLSEGLSAKETAYSCGFNNYNNFLKVFKRETGVTTGRIGPESSGISTDLPAALSD